MSLPYHYQLAPYDTKFAHALEAMWRASFERVVGVTDPHSMQEQVEYLHGVVVPNNRVTLVLDEGNRVVAFLGRASARRCCTRLCRILRGFVIIANGFEQEWQLEDVKHQWNLV